MNPNTSTALLWGGFALILLGFGGCVASGGLALTGAMDPRVYNTAVEAGTVAADGSPLARLGDWPG